MSDPVPHDEQPTVLAAWAMPPSSSQGWAAVYTTVELPLGVALSAEQRGWCTRIGEWPARVG